MCSVVWERVRPAMRRKFPVAPYPRHPRVPARAVTKQVPLDARPHLVRLMHGQRLADLVEQPAGAFEMAVGAGIQALSAQPQLLTPASRVFLPAAGGGPVSAKPLPHIALQCALDRVHGREEPFQAPALLSGLDQHDDADLLRPLPKGLFMFAPTSEATALSGRSDAAGEWRWLNGYGHEHDQYQQTDVC